MIAPVEREKKGVISAVVAFLLWGVLPLYWKSLQGLPPATIIGHRTLWSMVLLVIVLVWRGEFGGWVRAFREPAVVGRHMLSGVLLVCNWLLYVWATLNGHIVEGALGYYLNPFFNMLFGALWFGERHTPRQKLAIAVAAAGVLPLFFASGTFPWIALSLALTFSLYGVARKGAPLNALPGQAMETALLTPFALAWLLSQPPGLVEELTQSWQRGVLLLAAGAATTVPLLCFSHAARTIRLSTLGVLQFIGPTLQFLIGWKMYGEPLSALRLGSFGLIWTAVGLYAADALMRERAGRGCP